MPTHPDTLFDVRQINVKALSDRWWLLAIRGLAAIAFGVLTLVWPGVSLFVLVVLFGAYALVDGVFNLYLAVSSGRQGRPWGALAFEAVLSVLAGIVTFFWPGITALALLYVIAAWAVLTGIAEISAAIRLRKLIRNEWLLGLVGLCSIALGILMFARPTLGALAVAAWIAAYAIIFGVLLEGLAFRLRSWGRHPEERGLPAGGMPTPA